MWYKPLVTTLDLNWRNAFIGHILIGVNINLFYYNSISLVDYAPPRPPQNFLEVLHILCLSNPNIFLKIQKALNSKHTSHNDFGERTMALYKKDGKHDHCGFFQLLGFRLGLRETLVPSEFSFSKAFFPLCPSPHSYPFCQNLLSRKVLRAGRSELMLCSFGLDPAQVLSEWHLITGRQETEGYLPAPRLELVFLPSAQHHADLSWPASKTGF